MIIASYAAGLINKNTDLSLFLGLESEVAGIYYFSDLSSSYNMDKEESCIICNIGAGTVDICAQRKTINDSLSKSNKKSFNNTELIEEYPPIGGDYGGNVINEEFIKRLITKIFGEEKVKHLQNDPTNEDWDEFEKKIELLKKSYSDIEPCDFKLDWRLFEDDSIDKKLDDYISEYNSKNHEFKYQIKTNRRWELIFPSQIFSDITKDLAGKIFIKIEEIYNNAHTGDIITTCWLQKH